MDLSTLTEESECYKVDFSSANKGHGGFCVCGVSTVLSFVVPFSSLRRLRRPVLWRVVHEATRTVDLQRVPVYVGWTTRPEGLEDKNSDITVSQCGRLFVFLNYLPC